MDDFALNFARALTLTREERDILTGRLEDRGLLRALWADAVSHPDPEYGESLRRCLACRYSYLLYHAHGGR